MSQTAPSKTLSNDAKDRLSLACYALALAVSCLGWFAADNGRATPAVIIPITVVVVLFFWAGARIEQNLVKAERRQLKAV